MTTERLSANVWNNRFNRTYCTLLALVLQ